MTKEISNETQNSGKSLNSSHTEDVFIGREIKVRRLN